MSKKPRNGELPISGPGVERLEIAEIEKAIAKYEKKKEARCAESPGEIAAKAELKLTLQRHKEELPVNGEGIRFYRAEDRDYLLEEKVTVKKHVAEGDDD